MIACSSIALTLLDEAWQASKPDANWTLLQSLQDRPFLRHSQGHPHQNPRHSELNAPPQASLPSLQPYRPPHPTSSASFPPRQSYPPLNSPTHQIPSLPFNLTLHFIPLTQIPHLYPDHPTQFPPFMEDLLPPPFSILPNFHPHLTSTKQQQQHRTHPPPSIALLHKHPLRITSPKHKLKLPTLLVLLA